MARTEGQASLEMSEKIILHVAPECVQICPVWVPCVSPLAGGRRGVNLSPPAEQGTLLTQRAR